MSLTISFVLRNHDISMDIYTHKETKSTILLFFIFLDQLSDSLVTQYNAKLKRIMSWGGEGGGGGGGRVNSWEDSH